VEVEYIRGKPAVLTIFENDDDVEGEDIALFELSTLEALHEMMVEKGFERMSEDEIEGMKANKKNEQEEEDSRNPEATKRRDEKTAKLEAAYKEKRELEEKKKRGENANEDL